MTPVGANVQGMASKPETPGLGRFDASIDRDAEVPIGVQLAWVLRSHIHEGRFRPGQRLPGLRDLAEASGVNINTVKAVYQRLDQEGLIDSQQGSGTFVAPAPRRRSDVATIAAQAAREAHETGVDPREVAAALYVSHPLSAQSTDEEAARRSMLRGQIAALERTLVEIEATHPGVGPPSKRTRSDTAPTLPDVSQLEEVRALLVRRLAALQTAIDRLASNEVVAEAPQTAPASSRPARRKTAPRPAPAGA
jgi:DNA-binding transcriptional regulator YhcF (GntR family)